MEKNFFNIQELQNKEMWMGGCSVECGCGAWGNDKRNDGIMAK